MTSLTILGVCVITMALASSIVHGQPSFRGVTTFDNTNGASYHHNTVSVSTKTYDSNRQLRLDKNEATSTATSRLNNLNIFRPNNKAAVEKDNNNNSDNKANATAATTKRNDATTADSNNNTKKSILLSLMEHYKKNRTADAIINDLTVQLIDTETNTIIMDLSLDDNSSDEPSFDLASIGTALTIRVQPKSVHDTNKIRNMIQHIEFGWMNDNGRQPMEEYHIVEHNIVPDSAPNGNLRRHADPSHIWSMNGYNHMSNQYYACNYLSKPGDKNITFMIVYQDYNNDSTTVSKVIKFTLFDSKNQ